MTHRQWLVLAAAQALVLGGLALGKKDEREPAPSSQSFAPPYVVGDSVPLIRGAFLKGLSVEDSVADGLVAPSGLTLLLVASEKCQYCEAALPHWRSLSLLRDSLARTGVQLRLISIDSPEIAQRWLTRSELNLALFSMDRGESGESAEFRLGHRVPWAILLNSSRHVIAEGHGVMARSLLERQSR